MVNELTTYQWSIRTRLLCAYTAEKSVCRRCGFASRGILPSRRCNQTTLVVASTRHSSPDLSKSELQSRLNKAVGLISTADLLAPFDRSTYSAPLVIWQAIADVPSAHRSKLLGRLTSRDIQTLWGIAGQRYDESKQQLQLTVGSYSIYDDLPSDLDQVTVFTGKAAVPLGGIFGFQKAFFLHPETDELYGRVQLQKGPLGNALYPLYYKASVGPSIIAATDELTDVQLQYYSPENLCLEPQHLPKNWPRPREPLYPFSGGLVDYCRLVAPGVLVGVGWKAARPGKDVGRRFLYFMLVRTE
ncbi:hypothetical protein ABBQ38_007646 [Trebouxia sp. C0009 RCD-2024]